MPLGIVSPGKTQPAFKSFGSVLVQVSGCEDELFAGMKYCSPSCTVCPVMPASLLWSTLAHPVPPTALGLFLRPLSYSDTLPASIAAEGTAVDVEAALVVRVPW